MTNLLPAPAPVAAAVLKPGDGVQWWDNGLRFGHVVSIGRKWAVVLYVKRKIRIPVEELKLYG